MQQMRRVRRRRWSYQISSWVNPPREPTAPARGAAGGKFRCFFNRAMPNGRNHMSNWNPIPVQNNAFLRTAWEHAVPKGSTLGVPDVTVTDQPAKGPAI